MNAPTSPTPRPARGWRILELGFWPVTGAIQTVANATLVLMEDRRGGSSLRTWEPFVWEGSSNLVLLLLLPVLLWFTRRFPLHIDTWRRHLPWHLLASVAFSLAHVLGMVALREIAYATQGAGYDFGHWPSELVYEYLKDVRTYALFVAVIEGYRFLRRRLQGEVRILDAPDAGPPLESVERPERFLVRKLGREFLVAAADVEWAQASGNYVNLRMRGRDYPLRSTLAGLESMLDPARYARIHRSYLVNLHQVDSIEPVDTGDARVHLKDGTVLPCSRRYRDSLRGRLFGAGGSPSEAVPVLRLR